MKKATSYIFSMVACLATSISFAADFNFKAGHDQPVGSSYDLMMKDFAKVVEEKSDGRIAISVYPAAQLGSELELTQGLRLGTVDFAAASVGNISSLMPKVGLMGAPYLFESIPHRQKVIAGGSEFYNLLSDYLDESRVGIKLLGITTAGVRSVYNSKKPINTLDDIKGMNIRTLTSEAQVKGWQNLGAIPTPIAFAELYSALQTGVVDAAENSPEFLYLMKHYEQAPYFSLTEHMMATGLFMGSARALGRLPDDLLEVVMEAGIEVAAREQEHDMEMSDDYMRKLEEEGVKINAIEDKGPWIEAAIPLHDQLAKDLKATEMLEVIRAAAQE